MNPFVLRNVNVLDESGGFTGPVDIHVEGQRIAAIGRDVRAPDARSLDFTDLWLMPGIFDCHVHVALSEFFNPMASLRTPITQWTLEAAQNLRRMLQAGVTFARDMGGADAGIRDSIDREYISGPRLQVAVTVLCQTGGQVDGFLPGPGLELSSGYLLPEYLGRPPYLVDGVDEMRKAVRAVLRAGADWIKICTSGGPHPLTPYGDAFLSELTYEEIEVAVVEAKRKSKHVMADAKNGEAIDNAVDAGVHSIEHGIFLTEKQASRMAQLGCWLVPTQTIYRDIVRWARDGRISLDDRIVDALETTAVPGTAVAIASEYGVNIAYGTDCCSREQHGHNLEGLPLLHQAGLSVEETLLAATIQGARLCGVDDRLGRLAPGYEFDAIVLDHDPSDLTIFSRADTVRGVFKQGLPVVPHDRWHDAPSERRIAIAIRTGPGA